MCCLAIHAFGTQNETHGAEFEVFASTYLLFFHSLLCTIGVSMYTACEVVWGCTTRCAYAMRVLCTKVVQDCTQAA